MSSNISESRSLQNSSELRRWLALALLGTAFFMVILDATSVYVAIPTIEADLGFSAGSVQWVTSAYLITFGGLQLLGGRSADLLGRRRVFMAGVGLFVSSSLACGLAWSAEVLIAARIVQGVSAAIMAPTALSILMTIFEEGPQRNKALGIWGGIGGVGATAGLLVGGLITDGLGWEWVFFINVPVGVGVFVLSPVLLGESRDLTRRRSFDVAGAATITTALVLLIYAISEAPDAGWESAQTIGLLASAVALVGLFVLIETRSAAPLVPLRALRSRTMAGGNLVLLAAGMSVDGMLIILTLYAQQVLGYSTVEFGLMTAVMTVMSVVGTYGGQGLVTRIGFRPVAAAGMVLLGIACLLLTQVSVDGNYLDDMFFALLIFGTGLGFAFVASQIAALAGIAEEESGLAAGLVDTSFNIGGAIGIATLTTVAVSRTNDVVGVGGSQTPLALTEGYQSAFAVGIGFALFGLLAALALLGRRDATPEARASDEAAPQTAPDVGPVMVHVELPSETSNR
jgi:EmrB/QacA subfamily drug resistance transporter